MAGELHSRGGMCGKGPAWQVLWQGACMAGGMCGRSCAWQGVHVWWGHAQ